MKLTNASINFLNKAKIDQLVYALYGLTAAEIALVASASAKGAKP